MKRKTAVALVVGAVALAGCVYQPEAHKNEASVRKAFKLYETFSEIEVEGPVQVVYTKGETDSIVMEGDPAILYWVDINNGKELRESIIRVEGSTLKMDFSANGQDAMRIDMKRHWHPVVRISSPTLHSVVCMDRARFTTTDTIAGETVSCIVLREGRITTPKLSGKRVELTATGEGMMNIKEIESEELRVSGYDACKISADKTEAKKAELTGAGHAHVRVGWITPSDAEVSREEIGMAEVKYRVEEDD
ncbi:MAG: DUF2807 domain-containing protein [Bacteroidales bacterium]|jgi:hypothetical protein|nr:DUF2807 domain-containing protein [Bacteroidales bacterium]